MPLTIHLECLGAKKNIFCSLSRSYLLHSLRSPLPGLQLTSLGCFKPGENYSDPVLEPT